MDNLDHYINEASTEKLQELFLKLNDKMGERVYEKLNPLYLEVKNFFSSGNCFVNKGVYDGNESLLFVRGVTVTRTKFVVIIKFEEGYRVSYSEGKRNSVMLSQANYTIEFDEERKFEGWSNVDDYLFASSKDFLEDISKKVKKWIENKTL